MAGSDPIRRGCVGGCDVKVSCSVLAAVGRGFCGDFDLEPKLLLMVAARAKGRPLESGLDKVFDERCSGYVGNGLIGENAGANIDGLAVTDIVGH